MNQKVALHNLGCKVNAYEMEAMEQLLKKHGYQIVPFAPGADIYIINTCTVTNIADRKSRQMLSKARKMNPDSIVVAAGCYVEGAKEKVDQDLSIDLIIGNNMKKELIKVLENFQKKQTRSHTLADISHTTEYEELQIDESGEHTRVYVKVQDGCNQFCTYCIIPFTRGRVRSRSCDAVVREVSRLAKAGYQEVVLTGIHLSSYGVDMEGDSINLLTLVQQVHQVDGIARIRLGSLEPGIITEEFVQSLSRLEKVCPHFHLSLQSGSNQVLKRMKRRYTREEFEEKCRIIRRYYQHPALTTDIIVGFPGETQEEFEETKEFVQKIRFYETHIFRYSKRAGTKAADMPDQICESEKAVRSNILIQLGEKNKRRFMEQMLGEEVEVLAEELTKYKDQDYIVGHTREYLKAMIPQNDMPSGPLVKTVVAEVVKNDAILVETL